MSLKDKGDRALEEERRLTYVAITRAEKGFYMSESEGYNFITEQRKYPSRFLLEINNAFYVRKGTLTEELLEEAKALISGKIKPNGDLIFAKGDLVNHVAWGKGVVDIFDEEKEVYAIDFNGAKRMVQLGFKGLTSYDDSDEDFLEKAEYQDLVKVAKNEYSDALTQKTFYENHLENWKYLSGVGNKKLLKKIREDYPKHISLQREEYDKQNQALQFLKTVKDKKILNVAKEFNEDNYHRQMEECKELIECKKFMKEAVVTEVAKIARKDYPDNYCLQKREYIEQLEAKEFIRVAKDRDAKSIAVQNYPNNFCWQKSEYNDQLEAKEFMSKVADGEIKIRILLTKVKLIAPVLTTLFKCSWGR
jgi:DNA helicase-2/ATP-dependent DNA helicase PcrA